MSQPEQPIDEHGFPIPRDFDGEDARPKPRRPKTPRSPRPTCRRRLVAAGIVLLLVGALTFPILKQHVPALLASWYRDSAHKRYQSGDLPGALEDIGSAISLRPDDAVLYRLRSRYRLDDFDTDQHVQMSLEDISRAIELRPDELEFYSFRSSILQRLGRFREAIEDIDHAIRLAPPATWQLLNNRAYIRALGKMDLEQALDDVEKSIRQTGETRAISLDTRGYIRYLLERYEPALRDMNQAILLAQEDRRKDVRKLERFDVEPGLQNLIVRGHDHILAVLYHHRGLIHQKLGHEREARADLERGDELGYDPKKGVW